MNEIKPGEQVHFALKQVDKNGFLIMDSETRWYGFENPDANAMVNDLIDAIQERTQHYSEAKNA